MRKEFIEAKKNIFSQDFFSWGEEKNILLTSIDEKDFYRFIDKFASFLTLIQQEIKAS